MIRLFAFMSFVFLVSCGVDGEPIRPSLNGGVSINSSGVYPSASVGLNKGPLSLRLGL